MNNSLFKEQMPTTNGLKIQGLNIERGKCVFRRSFIFSKIQKCANKIMNILRKASKSMHVTGGPVCTYIDCILI